MANEALQTAWLKGYIEGLRAYAWWKDGVQYVGTCGTTLKEAIEDAEREYAVQTEDDREDRALDALIVAAMRGIEPEQIDAEIERQQKNGGPTCGKCGGVMTPANSRKRPELFLHDDCLPAEAQG